MKHLRRIFVKFCLLFANSKVEAELAREIGAHLAFLEDEYLRQGMTPEGARRAARLAYGVVEQATQLHRDERAFQGLGQILQDTRYTFRQEYCYVRCRSPTRIVWSSEQSFGRAAVRLLLPDPGEAHHREQLALGFAADSEPALRTPNITKVERGLG